MWERWNGFRWFKKKDDYEIEDVEDVGDIYYFTEDQISTLYHLVDALEEKKTKKAKYILWRFLIDTLELDDIKKYRLVIEDIMHPYVEEKI